MAHFGSGKSRASKWAALRRAVGAELRCMRRVADDAEAVAAAQRRSWKNDLYAYRKEMIELLFQRVIQSCDLKACPVKVWARNGAFVIASVWLYQVIFLSNHRRGRPTAHVKEQVDLARWRITA